MINKQTTKIEGAAHNILLAAMSGGVLRMTVLCKGQIQFFD